MRLWALGLIPAFTLLAAGYMVTALHLTFGFGTPGHMIVAIVLTAILMLMNTWCAAASAVLVEASLQRTQ